MFIICHSQSDCVSNVEMNEEYLPENLARSSTPSFTALEPHSEQIGGGRQKSPPPVQTPTKLRTRIRPTSRDGGLVRKSARNRAKLVPDNGSDGHAPDGVPSSHLEHFSGDSSQGRLEVPGGVPPGSSFEFSRCSVSRERSPVGPREPHFMQEVFTAPCDAILPQPTLITMSGQTQQDLPIRSGEQDAYDFSSLDVPAPSWDSIAGGSFDVMQPNNLFIPHESHLPEHNTPPHVPLPTGLNIPATRVIPPTPVNPVMMGNLTMDTGVIPPPPANPVMMGNLAMDTQGGPSGAAVVGRRSEDANAAMEKQFDLIDCAINELVVSTGMPTQQVLNLFLKSRGRVNNGTNHWNIYGQYFKAHRLRELQRAGKDANIISKSVFVVQWL